MIALARIIIPLAILFVLAVLIWSRFKRFKQQKSGRIEVQAEVVSSEQHEARGVSDIPKSATTSGSTTFSTAPTSGSSASYTSSDIPKSSPSSNTKEH